MQTSSSSLAASRHMEHRWGERFAIECRAQLILYDGAVGEGRLLNASISGALIATGVRLAPLTPLSVMLSTGNGAHRSTIELPACVVRIAREGIAVEWRDMAIATVRALLHEADARTNRL
jgi:hypothetical protein